MDEREGWRVLGGKEKEEVVVGKKNRILLEKIFCKFIFLKLGVWVFSFYIFLYFFF